MGQGRQSLGSEGRLIAALARRFESPGPALLALALWLLATAGWRPLMLPDEGRYAEVAREMLLGDGWVPTLNGLPFFHKPPLMYWIDMAALSAFGVHPFAARVAPLLGAWLMGASLWFAVRRRSGARRAGLALVLLGTTPFFFIGAQFANHDMLVAGLISAAVLAFMRALDERPAALRWIVAGWTACALALLTKGLIGFVLPALVIAPWLLVHGRWRELLRLLHPLGLLAFACIGLPWFVLMQLRFPGFFDYFILDQHVRRFAAGGFNNVQPFWFYLAVLPALTLPWSLWLPALWRHLRAARERDPHAVFLAWWVVVVVGFFSLPSSKLIGYVLPALVPWCALLAQATGESSVRRWRVALSLAVLACVGSVAMLAWQAPKSHREAGRALASLIAPGDRVVMVDLYYYDLPFEARLREPVWVASNWDDPDIARRDNWRKELHDAARFAPESARARLWPLAQLPALACGPAAWWLVTAAAAPAPLAGAQAMFEDRHTRLWRMPARPCS